MNVEFLEISNPIGSDYLIGNKLECLNHGNSTNKVFLDTDIMCCQSFDFPNLEDNTIAVKPADRNTCDWDSLTWSKAYEKYANYDLKEKDILISTAFKEMMHPYFNAGVIQIKGNKEFSTEWIRIAKSLDNDSGFTDKRPWLDQLALPLTIKKLKLNLKCLNEDYNFPANIKLVTSNTKLVHYHRPDIITKNSLLINCINQISSKYPWILDVLSNQPDWCKIENLCNIQKRQLYINPPTDPTQNVIITGIPRSGTSYLCSLLSKIENTVVINEPKEVLRPLKKRYIPWGVAGYYANIRRDIIMGEAIINKQKDGKITEDTMINNERELYYPTISSNDFTLITKNTMGYLTAMSRLLMVMPCANYIGVFRCPVDTIASWKSSFQHLKEAIPANMKILATNEEWLDKADRELVDHINHSGSVIVRQALLWNLFASQLLKYRHRIKLISYTNIVQKPNKVLIKIFNQPEKGKLIFNKAEARSKSHFLTNDEKTVIHNLTLETYRQLQSEEKTLNQ